MRRKTIAKRVLDLENEDEQEHQTHDEIDVKILHSNVSFHDLQKRRKPMYSAIESGEEISPSATSLQKFKTRTFYTEHDNPGAEHWTGSHCSLEESDGLQYRSKGELIAMVLCMQKEMESLKEQLRCLTACGKLARNLEALMEKTQVWSSGESMTPSPSTPSGLVENDDVMPALALSEQWGMLDTQAQNGQPPESHTGSQRNGQQLFQEFITPELLGRCNTGTTAQKLTNDLLRGLYERECLASHSISGIVYNKRGQPKPALPPEEVQAILRAVQHYFPAKTDAEIKGYIRQKLQNEAKRLRRKPHLCTTTTAEAGTGNREA